MHFSTTTMYLVHFQILLSLDFLLLSLVTMWSWYTLSVFHNIVFCQYVFWFSWMNDKWFLSYFQIFPKLISKIGCFITLPQVKVTKHGRTFPHENNHRSTTTCNLLYFNVEGWKYYINDVFIYSSVPLRTTFSI